MAEGKRPGGLTALAVLNFVFGGLKALGVTVILGLLAAAKSAGADIGAATQEAGVSVGILYLQLALAVAICIVLITSGVGYIKQKRFLGRTLGNIYAVMSITTTVIDIVAVPGAGVGLSTIIFLVYPLVTLFLLNTTFKDDLVN